MLAVFTAGFIALLIMAIAVFIAAFTYKEIEYRHVQKLLKKGYTLRVNRIVVTGSPVSRKMLREHETIIDTTERSVSIMRKEIGNK